MTVLSLKTTQALAAVGAATKEVAIPLLKKLEDNEDQLVVDLSTPILELHGCLKLHAVLLVCKVGIALIMTGLHARHTQPV